MTHPESELLLPDGYAPLRVLASRGSVRLVHALRGETPVLLRLEGPPRAGSGPADPALLAALSNPGLAETLEHGVFADGVRWVARRWVDGQALGEWAVGRTSEEIGACVARLCPALEELHRAGVVGAGLEPDDVVVAPDGRPVLRDYGAAPRTEPGEDATGAPLAVAPEVLLGLEPTASSDLFALGALLHRLLVGSPRRAREFYALFPDRSYLDAAGSDPEDLPPWARDLIVSLTARDPNRRPRSAAGVARVLAERLRVEMDPRELEEPLSWPVAFGRDAWVAQWLEQLSGEASPLWVRLPDDEDPRPFWRHLRLFSALRGRSLRAVDLGAELETLEHGVALDRWAAELAAGSGEWIAVLATERSAWHARGLETLERACALERRRQGAERPRLFVVAASAPVSPWFEEREVPAVTEESIARFLERPLAAESSVRRSAFAARLAAAAQGSATRLDRALRSAQRDGWLACAERAGPGAQPSFRLRAGPLPGPAAFAAHEATDAELAARPRGDLELLCALQVDGGRSRSDELAASSGLDARELGAAALRLRRDGWTDGEHGGETLLARALAGPALGAEALRAAHERRARALEDAGRAGEREGRARVALHRFCARADAPGAAELVRALAALREGGRAELALELAERARESCALLGVDLAQSAPELVVERARAWCSLGETDAALREVEGLSASSDARLVAWVELVRAEVARLRDDAEQSFTHYERAAELDPAARVEAALGRVRLLHALGRDGDAVAALAALDPAALQQAGELEPRERIRLEALGAAGAQRAGRLDEARATLARLGAEAAGLDDPALEASLHLERAAVERAAGSSELARAELERAAEQSERAGLAAGLASARASLGALLREIGELAEAEAPLRSAMEVRERLGDVEGSVAARAVLGLAHAERGHARAAIDVLESCAEATAGAQRRRLAPLLVAKAAEARARIGDVSRADAVAASEDGSDPRVLLARARIEWLRGRRDAAAELAGRAEALAQSLKLTRLAREAAALGARVVGRTGTAAPAAPAENEPPEERPFELLRSERFREDEVQRLAEELARRGRDDRAARLFLALAARCELPERSLAHAAAAEVLLERCGAGLSAAERTRQRRTLLGEPDPWPGDFTPRSDTQVRQEESEMEIVSLLDINRQLVQQQDLDTLLGLIVEHALAVTGAERGFLVLEEHGELRFDTALDSARGDIARPEFEISGSVVRDALAGKRPVRVGNAVEDPKLGQQTSVVSLELRSILCVPFEISSEMRGAIYVDHRLRKGAFDDRAERLCRLLADQAALAILQVKRLEEIRALNRELERRVVEKEVDLQNARRALREAGTPEPGTLVGQSAALRRVQELIERAAPSDLPVLIVGESGTGKELAARALHERSPRKRAAFISENCAALPSSLIESELFGFRKGAFTGADRNRSGLFEQAAGGTLFLDEIGELPLDLQAKFLRVLESGEVRRLGDDNPHKVDFRLIVATNRDLEAEVREGRFRQDLFFRVAALQLRMPALAERAEDIELLVEHFLRLEESAGRPRRRISKRVLAALARRAWPGNVRELRNEVARLCVMSEGDVDDPQLVSRAAAFNGSDLGIKEIVPISELERRAIHSALEKTGGDKRRAAEMLGISRAKIYQRLKDWGEGKH